MEMKSICPAHSGSSAGAFLMTKQNNNKTTQSYSSTPVLQPEASGSHTDVSQAAAAVSDSTHKRKIHNPAEQLTRKLQTPAMTELIVYLYNFFTCRFLSCFSVTFVNRMQPDFVLLCTCPVHILDDYKTIHLRLTDNTMWHPRPLFSDQREDLQTSSLIISEVAAILISASHH